MNLKNKYQNFIFFLEFKFIINNLFIAIEFILRLINPSIYINKESPIYIQEVFIGSKTINSDALKYPKGKNKLRL